MYLKSIEMQGFKSFADKTKVVFDQGVTAVVGPNGSGKSNITESLRWALGESSAKSLRGGKMPDVIFAGTENRKPLNYASVVVTLDNSKGYIKDREKEIRVERHIYRSGDSEYKIDGQKVRLRDVHDLFMDTGLGRDSFSIISQGRVEEIFNSKPEERRAIFEEAAGVLKYKSRKKETESKLAQTQDNLDRLEDIIYELDVQIKPLEKQAAVARQFLALDEKRLSLYLDVLVAQIKNSKAELTEKEEQLGQIKQDLQSYYQQRDQQEEDNQTLKAQRQKVQEQLEQEQAVLLELTKLISELERKIELHQLESSQQESQKQDAQGRLADLLQKEQVTQTQKEEKEAQIQGFQSQLSQLEQELESVEADLAHFSDDPEQVMEHLREQYVQLMQEEAHVSNRLTRVEQEMERQESVAQSQSSELEQLRQELAAAEAAYQTSQEEAQSLEARLKALLATYREQEEQLRQAEATYQDQQGRLFDAMDELKSKKARQSSLEAILKNHTNFYAGVRAVLQHRQEIGRVVGAVSEQVTFDSRYQTAMEIALGGASQHVIVEDEATAKAAIAYLRQHRQGRATFLPLTTIKPRYLSPQHAATLQEVDGFLGMASELVQFDQRLAGIFQNLLGTVAIFETIEAANQAARATKFQVRMVTLDGSEIRTGGAFAGGANRQQQTTFIKPELDALLVDIAALNQAIRQQEQELALTQESVSNLRAELSELQQQGETARLEEQKAKLYTEQAQKQLHDLQELYQLKQVQAGQGGLEDLQGEQQSLTEQLETVARKKEELLTEIEDLKGNREAVQERLQALQERQTSLTLQQTQYTGEIRFAQTELDRLRQELATYAKEAELLRVIIEQKEDDLLQGNVEVLAEQLQQAQARHEAASQAVIRLKFELEDIEGQIEDLREQMDKARLRNEDLIRSQTKLEARCEQLGQDLRRLLVQVTEQYQMSFEEAAGQAHQLENLAQAEQDLKELERSIRALGPVNIEAIEQYDEVHERLAFLSSQREDVLSARQLLLDTIHDMDEEVVARFKVTFEAIRESFQTTFRQIFGGGTADLLLTSEDWLTAGVEISVQPPGKKIQSLNLMSGGEKALSALALLFSIIRVKTIPFVILDEVEAALDEANVKRFGDYLNRFDKSSQFIVVTHRKGTMAAADAIYGVTMQESGVSKIVSVKLKDVEKVMD